MADDEKKTVRVEELALSNSLTLAALVELLEERGVVSREEVLERVTHRLEQHNKGVSRWTSRYRPWRLVDSREFPNYSEARKFENKLKAQKSGMGFFKEPGLQPKDFRTA